MVDFSVYVMTSEYGAASQLEKIDMLDFADLIVLNKYDKRGAEDALRDVRKQWKTQSRCLPDDDEDVPVYPTIASQFNDPGISWMFAELCRRVAEKAGLDIDRWTPDIDTSIREPRSTAMIPGARIRYLAEIAEQGRAINNRIDTQAELASRAQHVYESLKLLEDPELPAELEAYKTEALSGGDDRSLLVLRQRYQEAIERPHTELDRACCVSGRRARKACAPSNTVTRCVDARLRASNYRRVAQSPEESRRLRHPISPTGASCLRS